MILALKGTMKNKEHYLSQSVYMCLDKHVIFICISSMHHMPQHGTLLFKQQVYILHAAVHEIKFSFYNVCKV